MEMQKTLYICDGCGKEYRNERPHLRLTTNRCDATLSLFVDGKRIEVSCGEDIHFCGLGCLKAYFGDLIQALMGTGYLDSAETGGVEGEEAALACPYGMAVADCPKVRDAVLNRIYAGRYNQIRKRY